jgi:magnesium transporter
VTTAPPSSPSTDHQASQPTLVAGIYGMNFDNMPELHWKYGYFIVLGVLLLIMISLYLGFKRNKWL